MSKIDEIVSEYFSASEGSKFDYVSLTREGLRAALVRAAEPQWVRVDGPWIVDVKGGPNEPYFEISVLLKEYKHGALSYGWFGDNKLLITHNGGPCHWPLTQQVWDKVIRVAEEVASELNTATPPTEQKGNDL